jgi:RNA polymerase sigma-70 factor (ECF subfamily)
MREESASEIAEMIRQVRANRELLGSLLQRYRAHFTLVAQRRIGPKTAVRCPADDLVQQTFLEAARSFDQFRGSTESDFSAWLMQIFDGNLKDLIRKHRFARKRSVDCEEPLHREGGSTMLIWNEPAGRQSTPSRQVIRGEQALRLADLVKALPDMQSEAVRLRHLEGRSIAEIAQELGKSTAATAGLIKRGLQTLRSRMSEESWMC